MSKAFENSQSWKRLDYLKVLYLKLLGGVQLVDGQRYKVIGFYDGSEAGGGDFVYRASEDKTNHNGVTIIDPARIVAWDGTQGNLSTLFTAGAGFGCFVRISHNNVLDPRMAGAVEDTDSYLSINQCHIALIPTGGKVLSSERYICNGNIIINSDNILFEGVEKKSAIYEITDPSVSGYIFRWATTNDTSGGGLRNLTLKGVTNPTSGNAGALFGDVVFYANNWVCENVDCDSFGQFGIVALNGNNWDCSNIRVTNHGHTSTAIASCTGFNVFPRLASSGGRINNVYAEISASSIANSASMKIQTHQNLIANDLYCKGGTETCISIDSISGYIKGLTARAVTASPGIVLGNYSTVHSFRGEFILETVDCDDPLFTVSLSIGALASTDVEPKLKGCTLRDIECRMFRVNNYSAWQDCNFIDFRCSNAFRLDHTTAGVTPNTVAISGNYYQDIRATNTEIDGDNSIGANVTCSTGQFLARGNNNTMDNIRSINSLGDGITVAGDDNNLTNIVSIAATGRKVRVLSGNANLISGICRGGGATLDAGTGSLLTDIVEF